MSSLTFRPAVRADLDAVVSLLVDDVLGAERERTDLSSYETAFAEIDADRRHVLVVGTLDGAVVACLQATVLPCLTHGGRLRAQFEGVRVASVVRNEGVGEQLISWALDWARSQGCGVAQLTTDRRRPDAARFYERLGFEDTHTGLKLDLSTDPA